MGVTLALIRARLRAAGHRWLPTVVALGLGIMLPVASRAAGSVTADATLRRRLDELPTADRIVTVATYFEPGEVRPDGLDATARQGIARLGSAEPVHVLEYRPLSDTRGGTFQLTGAQDLDRWVRLVDGRMPQRCDPDHCEVVQLAERRPVGPLDPSLGVEVVGTVARLDPLLLAGTFEPEPDASVLLADGIDGIDHLRSLESFGRSQGWLAEVDLARVRSVGVDTWAATAVATANELLTAPWNLGLVAPDRTLATEVARARRSAQRFLLLGSAMGVLLLGASVVAGTAMRRDHEGFIGVLRRRGVSPRRLGAVAAGEVAGVVVAGAGFGLALGSGVGWLLARRAGLDPATVVRPAVGGSVVSLAAFAVASAGLIMATLLLRGDRTGRRDAWRLVDMGLVVGLFSLGLLVTRDSAADRPPSATLALLPALSLITGGLLTARLWPLLAGVMARLAPRRAVAGRLGIGGATGRPLRPVATSALLACAIGATVFAVAYRQTLHRGADDQAAEAVPIDARMTTGRALERALDLVTPGSDVLPPGATAWPVLRSAASVRVSADRGETVQMIGVDPAMLGSIRRWSATTGGGDAAGVSAAIDTPRFAPALRIPLGHQLSIDVTGPAVRFAVTATIRTDDGRVRAVPMRIEPEGGADGPQTLVGELPELPGVDGADVVALTAVEASDATTRRQHNLGEGNKDRESPSATVMLGALSVDEVAVPDAWTGWSGLVPDGDRQRWDFVMAASRVTIVARPTGPGEPGDPLPAAVDPATAASSGGIGTTATVVLNQVAVPVRVAAVLQQFPTVNGRFAIVDRAALQRLIDRTEASTGQPGELWVDLGDSQRRLDDPVFERLTVTYRDDVAEHLQTDPVARSASRILLGAAGLTMVLAVVLLTLFAMTERHDDAAQSLAWEAEGVTPGRLRRSLVWRSVAIVAPAIPFGLAAGLALSRLTARMIAVTATATVAKPPLVPGTGAWWGVLAALGCAALGAAAVGLVATRSWREPMPSRITGGI